MEDDLYTYGPWVQFILFTIMCTLKKTCFQNKIFSDLNYELSIILRLAILETDS
jgi:hypothetical protein